MDVNDTADLDERVNIVFKIQQMAVKTGPTIFFLCHLMNDVVDIVILKGVTKKEELRDFRKNRNLDKPILLQISKDVFNDEFDITLKASDGIVISMEYLLEDEDLKQKCHDAFKPVYHLATQAISEYYGRKEESSKDEAILTQAVAVAENRLHGVVLIDDGYSEELPMDFIKNLVRAMNRVDDEIESEINYFRVSHQIKLPAHPSMSMALAASLAAVKCAASLILVMTATGRSVRWIAFAAPPCPVLAITKRKSTVRQLHMYKRVIPLLYDKARDQSWRKDCWKRIRFGTDFGLKLSLTRPGAKLVVLAPSEDGVGFCDAFQIVSLENDGKIREVSL